MSETAFVHGSGNVFRDLGLPDPDLEQARAIVAARILMVIDRRGLSPEDAARLAGVPTRTIQRVRSARLAGLSLDRLIAVLGRLDAGTAVTVTLTSVDPDRSLVPA